MPQLPDFKLETWFSKWEFAARYHMTASDAQSLTLSQLLDFASPDDRDRFERMWLGYTQTWGAPDLREAIASTYDTIRSDQVLCFAGAEEGLYAAMQTLLTPNDHVIVITPNYQSAETIPLSLCAVTGVPLDPDGQWALDMDRLEDAIRPNTRVISVNFPHNPTGKILEREKFSRLVTICRRHGIWLFCDEVYRLIERDPAIRLPNVADVYERGLSLNVMSKAYGLPGLRIGWIACQDVDLLRRMERMKHYLSICNSGPSEQLALIALKARDTILGRNRDLAQYNVEKLDHFFAEFPHLFEWRRPDGGLVGYPRYKGVEGVEAFASKLVEDTGVLLLPASIYQSALGATPVDRFRIGYGRANIAEGLGILRDYIYRNTPADRLTSTR